MTIGALSERTEVNIETIRLSALVSCRSRSAVETGPTPKNISGAWSSSDGGRIGFPPWAARFFASVEIGTWHWASEAHHRKARC